MRIPSPACLRVSATRKGTGSSPLTHANGQPALAVYRPISADGAYRAFALQVLTNDRASGYIAEVTSFLSPELFARFGCRLNGSGEKPQLAFRRFRRDWDREQEASDFLRTI
jgi:hypothetical protein